jgi:outer membrane receptor protein involved in Fe transport
MMRKKVARISTVLLSLWLSLPALSALGQTATTGTIEGTITDSKGGIVSGVTVTATSPNLIRAQTATSDSNGRYRLANLPPGKYSVTAEGASGFAKFERADVEVNLSKASSVEIVLQPAGASEQVTVTATAGDVIDATSNTTGSSVSNEQFSNFPTQRTVQSLYTIAPTVSRSGLRDASGRDRDPSVGGSSGPENNYILDGVTTTDPAFGGSGANLPFEFVQEVEIKTGAFGAEYGKSTGGIFNVITKSGGNDFHGDVFTYFSTKGMVRDTKNFPFTGPAPNGFSEVDAGFDLGGRIIKDKLWFFGAFNPQRRNNFFFTQTFRDQVKSEVTTPFYAGKLTYALSQNHTLTFSTFGDFTKQTGFGFGGGANDANIFNGFGADPNTFLSTRETGGQNYAFRLNSSISPTWIAEISFGMHFQRFNVLPADSVTGTPLVQDTFNVVKNGSVIIPTQTNTAASNGLLISFVRAPGGGGSLERNFISQGFAPGLITNSDRNRYEFGAKLANTFGPHTFKYGFEYSRDIYNNNQISTGGPITYGNPNNLVLSNGPGVNETVAQRISNRWNVCTTRGSQIVCPSATAATRAQQIAAQAGFASATQGTITAAEALNNPFLVLSSVRVRDFILNANTNTNVQSFYFQDDWKVTPTLLLIGGLRWDFQQAYAADGGTYLKLNKFWYNMQPRLGVSWDFTGTGRGKLFANYAYYVETPIPLDVNVRAGGGNSQTDKNFNVNRLNAPSNAIIIPGFSSTSAGSNLGAAPTPIDFDIKPQTVHEATVGVEYGLMKDLVLGMRGIYRAQGHVIEDGSFDDGDNYFLFNPGESETERLACANPAVGCFGRARRYYRGLEFTATKRFSENYQFIASYVYSSLIGNYEGLFRNDNGQSDPNITSLFDLVSLLKNSYGRLPNDRPHQFKLDGSYRTGINLLLSASVRAQSGIPLNELIPHPVYGNNEGFNVPRGSAGRTPVTTGLDLGAYYPIKISETKQLRFQADWFNVFNTQRKIRQDETLEITIGSAGEPNVPNPFFKEGTIFQYPSAIRLGVKFQF